MIATTHVSKRKYTADLKKSGSLGTRVNIFRMILPLLVAYPVFMTKASGLARHSNSFPPSQSHLFYYLKCASDPTANLPIGMLYPVRLASLTQTYPCTKSASQTTSVPFSGISKSPGTNSWLSIYSYLPDRITFTLMILSAISLIF